MIWLYTGTPGSGKSLHTARDIWMKIRLRHQRVIANFPVNEQVLYEKSKKHGKFYYVDNADLTVKFLIQFSKCWHRRGREGETLLIVDEAQLKFNSRGFGSPDRMDWIKFFSQHRKLGYNVILVTQSDRMLDRQIRVLVEEEVRHRKVNNYKFGPIPLAFLPLKLFACIDRWYENKEKLSTDFFLYNKKLGSLYDTFKMFEGDSF